MDWKLALLGSLPPFLAALAEVWNPVTKEAVRDGIAHELAQFDPPPGTSAPSIAHKVGEFAAYSAEGAVEVAAVIPTWIGVTAAISAAFAEILPPLPVAIGAAIWALVSGLFAPRFFARLRYHELATAVPRTRVCSGRLGSRCISLLLIGFNVLAIGVVLGTAWLHTEHEQQVEHQARPTAAAQEEVRRPD